MWKLDIFEFYFECIVIYADADDLQEPNITINLGNDGNMENSP